MKRTPIVLDHIILNVLHVFVASQCIWPNYLIVYQLMNIYKFFHIKTLKLLRHVSIQGSSSGSYNFLDKVTFKN